MIENVGGAGGMICAARGARADADGYTFMIHQVALAAGMSLYPNLKFDAEKDFAPIGLINTAASTLAAPATLPAKNFKELLAWMKNLGPQRQDRASRRRLVRSFGRRVWLLQELGVKVTQVPYRGAGPALVDLLSGQVDLESRSAIVSGPLVKSGKLKAYAIIGQQAVRRPARPADFGELGYKKLNIDFWHMLLAPAGTPRPIIDKLNAALRTALADPKVKKALPTAAWMSSGPRRKRPRPPALCSSARSSSGAT